MKKLITVLVVVNSFMLSCSYEEKKKYVDGNNVIRQKHKLVENSVENKYQQKLDEYRKLELHDELFYKQMSYKKIYFVYGGKIEKDEFSALYSKIDSIVDRADFDDKRKDLIFIFYAYILLCGSNLDDFNLYLSEMEHVYNIRENNIDALESALLAVLKKNKK